MASFFTNICLCYDFIYYNMTEYFCKFSEVTRPEAGKGSPAGNPYAVGVKVPHAAHPPYTSPARHTTPDNHNPQSQRCRGAPKARPSRPPGGFIFIPSFGHRPSAAAKNHPAHCAGWFFALWFCSRGGVCNPSGETVTLFSGQPLPGVQAGILLPVWLPPWPLWTGRCR